MRCSRKFVKLLAYLLSVGLFISMYLSLIDAFSEKMATYEDGN
jgi:hypothetical protein